MCLWIILVTLAQRMLHCCVAAEFLLFQPQPLFRFGIQELDIMAISILDYSIFYSCVQKKKRIFRSLVNKMFKLKDK